MTQPSSPSVLQSAKVTRELSFSLKPDAEARAALADALGVRAVKKLSFEGAVFPDGKRDLALKGTLGATVVQDCVVTLEPVTTRIDTPVSRRFVADFEMPDADEAEMPEDDSEEPLDDEILLDVILGEALALALPDFPRAEGVDPIDIAVTEPGKTPLSDEDAKPFAALKSLRDSIGDKGDTDS